MNIARRSNAKAASVRVLLLVVCALIVATAIAPTSALADWRSYRHIHVSIRPDHFTNTAIPVYAPFRSAAHVHVYGPGYYRYFYAPPQSSALSTAVWRQVATYAPVGQYRIRFDWTESSAADTNVYTTMNGWNNGLDISVESPR